VEISTSKLRVLNFSMSPEEYGAGPNQDLQNPLGANNRTELFEWFLLLVAADKTPPRR
jgi:hypothetical protein